jgi:sugar transferase EpsL
VTGLRKRFLDIFISVPAFILLFPLILFLGLVLFFKQGRPIFISQLRPGFRANPFFLYKFRTMTNCRDEKRCLLPDEQRLTSLGRLLRATSLDELPELINVIKGEMSLVGPRPLLMQYLDRYTPEQARRHEVKPGITGWAQVNGRNTLSWEKKFKLDVWYVDHQSLTLDLKIIFMTIWKISKQEGISQPGQATMEEFFGTTTEK